MKKMTYCSSKNCPILTQYKTLSTDGSKMHDNRTIPFYIEIGKCIIIGKYSTGYIPV